jgi:hypothetical protein
VREKSSAEGAGEGAVGIDVAGTWVEGDEVVGALVGSFEGAYVKPGTYGPEPIGDRKFLLLKEGINCTCLELHVRFK